MVDVSVTDMLANKPVGTGPHLLENWNPQTSPTLVANLLYWGDAPKTLTMALCVMPDATTQVSALHADDIAPLWN